MSSNPPTPKDETRRPSHPLFKFRQSNNYPPKRPVFRPLTTTSHASAELLAIYAAAATEQQLLKSFFNSSNEPRQLTYSLCPDMLAGFRPLALMAVVCRVQIPMTHCPTHGQFSIERRNISAGLPKLTFRDGDLPTLKHGTTHPEHPAA